MDAWTRLRDRLAARDATADDRPPPEARRGAALALLWDDDGEQALLLTRRRDDLPTHPGQLCFPGGRVERDETPVQAALREAAEECAVEPGTVEPLGLLPGLYIPPSRYWLDVVVARWQRPHALRAQPEEVAEVVVARVGELLDPATWRATPLRSRGIGWAWQLDDRHLLWGATALATARLLDLLAPSWNDELQPTDRPADRWVHPWSPSSLGPAR